LWIGGPTILLVGVSERRGSRCKHDGTEQNFVACSGHALKRTSNPAKGAQWRDLSSPPSLGKIISGWSTRPEFHTYVWGTAAPGRESSPLDVFLSRRPNDANVKTVATAIMRRAPSEESSY
jgi:hypothetical protein